MVIMGPDLPDLDERLSPREVEARRTQESVRWEFSPTKNIRRD